MKRLLFIPAIATGLVLAQDTTPTEQVAKAIPVQSQLPAPTPKDAASDDAPDDSPVPLPALEDFAPLWTDSLFTTRALPMDDAPAGPSFTDNLSLSGTYEERGKLTAILIDKTTSGIVQAYIGEDNEDGFRIAKIEPGESPDRTRIQLQKGNQVGWVSFSDASGGAPPTPQAPASGPLATRPGNTVQGPQPTTLFPQGAAPSFVPPALPADPPPNMMPQQSAAPSLRGGLPEAPPTLPGDPPLPPP